MSRVRRHRQILEFPQKELGGQHTSKSSGRPARSKLRSKEKSKELRNSAFEMFSSVISVLNESRTRTLCDLGGVAICGQGARRRLPFVRNWGFLSIGVDRGD